jgi:hypothetical protein
MYYVIAGVNSARLATNTVGKGTGPYKACILDNGDF